MLGIALAGRVGLEVDGEPVADPGLGSLGRLTLASQQMLHRLSVFVGTFTIDAATNVATPAQLDGPILDPLADLVDRCLVQADAATATASSRYRLAVALAEEAALQLEGPDQRPWFDRLAAERPDLMAALAWAASAPVPAPDEALRLAAALGRFWEIRGHVGEGRSWLTRALAAAPGSDAERGRACVAAATPAIGHRRPGPVAERAGYEVHQGRARRALGGQGWATATAAGWSMALDETLDCSRALVAP